MNYYFRSLLLLFGRISNFQASEVARLPVLSLFVVALKTLLELIKSSPELRVLPFRDFLCRSRALVSL